MFATQEWNPRTPFDQVGVRLKTHSPHKLSHWETLYWYDIFEEASMFYNWAWQISERNHCGGSSSLHFFWKWRFAFLSNRLISMDLFLDSKTHESHSFSLTIGYWVPRLGLDCVLTNMQSRKFDDILIDEEAESWTHSARLWCTWEMARESRNTRFTQVHEGIINSQYSLSPLVWEVDMFFPKLEGLIATEGTQTWQLSSGPPILCTTSHMLGHMVMNWIHPFLNTNHHRGFCCFMMTANQRCIVSRAS